MTPEGRILAAFLDWCDLRGILYIRLVLRAGVKTGWPDVEVLLRGGAPLFIEFKRPGDDVDPDGTQAERHAELRARGYTVVVADSLDKAIAAVTQAVGARAVPA